MDGNISQIPLGKEIPSMKEVTEVVLDDLEANEGNRVPGAKTYYFTVDNTNYSIDLTEESKAQMDEAMLPFIRVATRITVRSSSGGRTRSAAPRSRTDGTKIREWARANGYALNDRGRIPDNVKFLYEDDLRNHEVD